MRLTEKLNERYMILIDHMAIPFHQFALLLSCISVTLVPIYVPLLIVKSVFVTFIILWSLVAAGDASGPRRSHSRAGPGRALLNGDHPHDPECQHLLGLPLLPVQF